MDMMDIVDFMDIMDIVNIDGYKRGKARWLAVTLPLALTCQNHIYFTLPHIFSKIKQCYWSIFATKVLKTYIIP